MLDCGAACMRAASRRVMGSEILVCSSDAVELCSARKRRSASGCSVRALSRKAVRTSSSEQSCDARMDEACVCQRMCTAHGVCARVYSHGGAAHQIDAEDGERVVVSERRIHTHAIRRRAWRRKRRQAEERRSGKTRQHVARSARRDDAPRTRGVEKELRDSKHTHTLLQTSVRVW